MTILWPGRGGPAINYITAPPNETFRHKFPRNVAILGSTGSIGKNTLDVIEQAPQCLKVAALACGRNVELLATQALRHLPRFLAVQDGLSAEKLRALLPADYKPRILIGPEGYETVASLDGADIIVAAQMGFAGLSAAVAAALAGKVIALANKETLVIAGDLLRRICSRTGGSILPVDSEHYALFQCCGGRGQSVAKLVLTASGGPFRGKSRRELAGVRPEDALKHPNWSMGAKITIDSATLMNKGLEFIEAVRLYGAMPDKIEVVIHPQSIIHSLARFKDGGLLAQMAVPDMRLPIAGCLLWPRCLETFVRPLELSGALTFEQPDDEAFPALGLARQAAEASIPDNWQKIGINPICLILNAANEAAVELFLTGKCGFCDISLFIEKTMLALVSRLPDPEITFSQISGPAMADALARLDGVARRMVWDLASARVIKI